MVPKKTQSKRGTARQRYKIQKKVKDHSRKVKKDMKKHPEKYHKNRKDPGIPKLWPFREQLLQQIEDTKTKLADEKEQLRLRRVQQMGTERAQKRELADLKRNAEKRDHVFTTAADMPESEDTQNLHDTSKRAYYREFRKVLEAADVILEVLDARDPAGCRCPEIEQMILAQGSSKKIILVLNKIDLVPRAIVEKWLTHLRHDFPAVAFKASTQEQRQNLKAATAQFTSSKSTSGNECLGADTLMQLLKNYCRNLNLKTAITVGVIGYPNVGKSSLINSLKRTRACVVGAMPGVTKSMQEIQLDRDIRLLDCPGIVFRQDNASQGDLLLRNCLRIDQLEDPMSAVEAVLARCRREDLMMQYSIPAFNTTVEFLLLLAKLKGKLKKGGAPDLDATAKMLLQDWNNGKISFYTLPPVRQMEESKVVSQWSKEFDLSLIASAEGKLLDSLKEATGSFMMTAGEPLQMDNAMILPSDASDSEGEEAMEEDKTVKVPLVMSMPPKVKVTSKTKRNNGFTAEEDALNPRLNQQRKKEMKQLKKKQQKNHSVPMNDNDEEFDFAGDFVPVAEYTDEVDMKDIVDADEAW